MKHVDFAHRWTMLLLLLIGLTTPLSASHANSQIVVFDASATDSRAGSGLAKTAADAFQSRLNQMNFIVLDPVVLSRKAQITGASRRGVGPLVCNQSHYGNVLIIFCNPSSSTRQPECLPSIECDGYIVGNSKPGCVITYRWRWILLPLDCDAACAQILGSRAGGKSPKLGYAYWQINQQSIWRDGRCRQPSQQSAD